MVKYVVNENGSVSNATIDSPVSGSLDSEALRLTLAMPHFRPGLKDGALVKVYYKLSVVFNLKEDSAQRQATTYISM